MAEYLVRVSEAAPPAGGPQAAKHEIKALAAAMRAWAGPSGFTVPHTWADRLDQIAAQMPEFDGIPSPDDDLLWRLVEVILVTVAELEAALYEQ